MVVDEEGPGTQIKNTKMGQRVWLGSKNSRSA